MTLQETRNAGSGWPAAAPAVIRHEPSLLPDTVGTEPSQASYVPVTVAVVTENVLTLQGAVAALAEFPEIRPVPTELAETADVVIFIVDEVTQPLLSRVDEISSEDRGGAIVIVTERCDDRNLLRAMRAGVVGVLVRDAETSFKDIVQTAVAAHSGKAAMPPSLLASVIRQLKNQRTQEQQEDYGLSARDVAVLRLMADGYDTVQIARKLSYSDRTIKSIVHDIIGNLGVSNRVHAVAYAIREGIL
ncbi:LuxR C-terminal-related transcriptional regulator [Streptomyces sp. NPDC090080]|uniref:LuxR C-terminal-related transcriptional regulator n=1 Tax=Streptomyces sp. NPDC090080 TaxID=3365939 RepID=UPI00380C55AD